MVFGIGTDICDIRRLRATLERRGDRFAEKVLGPAELQVFHARRARAIDREVWGGAQWRPRRSATVAQCD